MLMATQQGVSFALDPERWLSLLTVASTAILSIRLFALGLHRRYRVFALYLVYATLHLGALSAFDQHSGIYLKIWALTEPLDWFFFAGVVIEIYGLVLEDYKGLATVGRWALIAAVLVALAASTLTFMAPGEAVTIQQSHILRYYYLVERSAYLSLVVFLATILAILRQYPISLRRNVVVHSLVFSIYFLANSAIYALLSLLGKKTLPLVTYSLESVTLIAVCAWLVLLKAAGEKRLVRLSPQRLATREEALVSQLNLLNQTLLRVARK